MGTTIAACFADLGHEVMNVDIDESVVETINADTRRSTRTNSNLIAEHTGPGGTGRLRATTDYDAILDIDVRFLCRPTDPSPYHAPVSSVGSVWMPPLVRSALVLIVTLVALAVSSSLDVMGRPA
jgi:UDP-glucose 6-dehydrogenase